jgi:hypothetical protein
MSARTRYQALVDLITPEFVRTAFPGPLDRYQDGVYGTEARDAPELLASFERCIEWGRSHGAINETNEAKIRTGKYPWLILGAVSRQASPERVDLLCDIVTWLTMTDDVIDSYQGAVQESLNDVRYAIGSFVKILQAPSAILDDGVAQYSGFFDALCSMARSISERIWKCHPVLASTVVQSVIEFFNGVITEFCYTHGDSQIEPWSYPEIRARTIVIVPFLDIVLLTNETIISTREIRDVTVGHLCLSSATSIAILNDVVSFRKEVLTAGEVFNNFAAFEFDAICELGIPEEKAARLALDRCTERYQRYRRSLHDQEPWLPTEINRRDLVNTLNDLVTCVIEWHLYITDRYTRYTM